MVNVKSYHTNFLLGMGNLCPQKIGTTHILTSANKAEKTLEALFTKAFLDDPNIRLIVGGYSGYTASLATSWLKSQ